MGISPAEIGLKPRDVRILQALADGLTVKQICEKEQLSVTRLYSEIKKLIKTMKATTRSNAVASALRMEIID